MKYFLIFGIIISFLFTGCFATTATKPATIKHVIDIRISSVDGTPVEVKVEENKENIVKSMGVENPEGYLSSMSFIADDEAFIKIFSTLTVGDVTRLWNDMVYLYKKTDIRKVNLFINSPGGDAFSGLALADQIVRAKKLGFEIIAHASGLVASAAVPVLAVCTKRYSAPGTIFMVHETSIWKWPGRETASDIRSQNKLMTLIRDRYLQKLADYSNLSKEEWGNLEQKTTWFSAEQAKEWGLIDEIQ